MSKESLINKLAENLGMTQAQSKLYLDCVLDSIKELTIENKQLNLRNFGVFSVNLKKSYTTRHLKTGKDIVIPESLMIRFKGCKSFREQAMNKK